MSRIYSPTATELNTAVEDVLRRAENDKKFQGLNEIQMKLEKENPTWKLPERRVAKFVKRQKAGNPIQDHDEALSVGGGSIWKMMFSGKKKWSSKTEATSAESPVKENMMSRTWWPLT